MILDNYTLTTFMTCPAKYQLNILQNWRPRRSSAALNAGQVLHKGLEEWYRTGSLSKALIAIHQAWPADHPVDDFRDLNKVISTMTAYANHYPDEGFSVVGAKEGQPQLEVSFTLPTGMCLDVCNECSFDNVNDRLSGNMADPMLCNNCNAPLESIDYGGIFDLLVERQGMLYVVDHKTTTMFGPKYWYQYKPNNQITGYLWGAAKLSGARIGGSIINVIAWYKSQATKFDRQITTRSPAEIEVWLENVRMIANLIHRANLTGQYPLNTGACTLYGQCEYHRVHELATPREQQKMLEMHYEIRKWDHEARDEKTSLPIITTP